jgi:hypothetical protein
MLAHYGVDVLDRRTSLRRVSVLLRRLPPGAWPVETSPASWSIESHLLASVLDSLAWLTYITVKAAGGKAREPKPVPRPNAPARPRGSVEGGGSGDADPIGWAGLARSLSENPAVVTRHG